MPNPLGSLFTRIRESLGHKTAYFLTKTEQTMGVSLDVSFKTMTHVHLDDLGARAVACLNRFLLEEPSKRLHAPI